MGIPSLSLFFELLGSPVPRFVWDQENSQVQILPTRQHADVAQRQSTKLLISGLRYRNSPSAQQWPSGVMGATLVLGTSVERRESSNLSLVTRDWLTLNNKTKRKCKIGGWVSG